jgi:N-acetylglucosaminyl-diphospho-decaprenol L-rhamnosyltransferase
MVKDLSIIIVTWNSEKTLPACIRSIATHLQELDKEVIVVDNASRDPAYLDAFTNLPWVSISRNSANLGFARANNLGVARSQGRYLLFLNPDVRFESNPLPALIRGLEGDAALGIVSPLLYGEDGRPQVAGYFMAYPTLAQLLLRNTLLARAPGVRAFADRLFGARIAPSGWTAVDQVPGAFMLFHRDLPVDRPFLDERFFIWLEDVDFCKRVTDSGLKVAVNASEKAVHIGGVSFSQVGTALKRKRFQASYQAYLRKHFAPVPARLGLAILAADSAAHMLLTLVWNLARGRAAAAASLARSEAGILSMTLGNLLGRNAEGR